MTNSTESEDDRTMRAQIIDKLFELNVRNYADITSENAEVVRAREQQLAEIELALCQSLELQRRARKECLENLDEIEALAEQTKHALSSRYRSN